MKELKNEILINACAKNVWDILMDFEKYPEWNGFFDLVSGKAEVGKKLINKMKGPDGKIMTFKPVVLEVKSEKCFRWLGHLGIPGLFDGEHRFFIEEIDTGKVKFTQQEIFKGFLVPFFWNQMSQHTLSGFEQFNMGLKRRAEK